MTSRRLSKTADVTGLADLLNDATMKWYFDQHYVSKPCNEGDNVVSGLL